MAPVWKRRRAGFSEIQARHRTPRKSPFFPSPKRKGCSEALCRQVRELQAAFRGPESVPGKTGPVVVAGTRDSEIPKVDASSIPFSLLSRTAEATLVFFRVLSEVSDLLWMLLDSGPFLRWCGGLLAGLRCEDRDGKRSRDALSRAHLAHPGQVVLFLPRGMRIHRAEERREFHQAEGLTRFCCCSALVSLPCPFQSLAGAGSCPARGSGGRCRQDLESIGRSPESPLRSFSLCPLCPRAP